ncbi:MAG: EI24 domain-containing protein [Planctomycetes bacterium]|nr:EI24 domain-containing protein [Planctomycetota bacterium]
MSSNQLPGRSRSSSGTGAFVDGFRTFFDGLQFVLSRPRLLPHVVAPCLLTLALFSAATVFAFYFTGDLHAWLFPEAAGWLWTTVSYVAVAVLLLVAWVFGLATIGSMIASPFNDYLSQRVELELLSDPLQPSGGVARLTQDIAHTLKHESIRLAIYVGLFVACLPLLIVPVAGAVLFSIALGYINIRYFAWNGLDYCMGRRHWRFRRKMAFLRRHRSRTLGYGTASLLFLSIPLTMLFVLPLLSVGGSILFCRIVREEE